LFATTGVGKRTPVSEFPIKGRGTGGVQAIISGLVLAAAAYVPGAVADGDVILGTTMGKALRLPARAIPHSGRASRGSPLAQLDAGEHVAALVVLPSQA
ncbi:MAG: DNA gyrase subunit A, partial [Chloroflexota bacterium]|nr:DNA gyrase subunit A [Chloroflexota bacterium]